MTGIGWASSAIGTWGTITIALDAITYYDLLVRLGAGLDGFADERVWFILFFLVIGWMFSTGGLLLLRRKEVLVLPVVGFLALLILHISAGIVFR